MRLCKGRVKATYGHQHGGGIFLIQTKGGPIHRNTKVKAGHIDQGFGARSFMGTFCSSP